MAYYDITIPAGRMTGDCDGDGYFKNADIDFVKEHYLESLGPTPTIEMQAADINGNGQITSTDLSYLLTRFRTPYGVTASNCVRDLLGVWSTKYDVSETTTDWLYCIDFPIKGLKAGIPTVVEYNKTNYTEYLGLSVKVNTEDGYVRIYTKLLPIAPIVARLHVLQKNTVTYRGQDFGDDNFVSGAIQTQAAPAGDSLAFDTMQLKVWHDGHTPPLGYNFYTSDSEMFLTADSEEFLSLDTMENFVPGDSMTYYYDDVLINKFYVQEVKRVGKQLYDVYAVSAIGLLNNAMHFGGIYNGTDIADVLAELLAGIIYEVDPLVSTIKLYGYLPYATKRDNLQQLTLAHSISVKMKSDGTLLVTTHRSESTGEFNINRTSLMGSVEKVPPVTAVQVSEHMYEEEATVISLCNESFLTERLIIFPEPCHDLVVTNGSIVSSSANHAYIQGAGAVTLTGEKYIHTMKRVTQGTVTSDSTDNILFVDNATLVTSLNSSKVAEKLYNAFTKNEIIKTDVIFGDERTGDIVNIVNPYTSVLEDTFARKMDISFGGFLKAQGEFVKDFTPAGVITGYQNRVLVTASGNWTVPAGVTEIRAILIGGGTGGTGGETGLVGANGSRLPDSLNKQGTQDDITNGTCAYLQGYNGEGGAGGLPGIGGTGGLVLDTGALVVTPAQVMAAVIGAGGAGGAISTVGSDGGNTTLDALTSATGARIARGYTDILTGDVFGINGILGRAGKDGRGKSNFNESNDTANFYDGIHNGTYFRPCGNWGLVEYYYIYYTGNLASKKWVFGVGGSGGGGAWTANWNDGYVASAGGNGNATYNAGHGFADGGSGGTGRTPQVGTNGTIYGGGGNGGNGGGGGGGGGAYANFWGGASYEFGGAGGAAGLGSVGGTGKAGAIIIYY